MRNNQPVTQHELFLQPRRPIVTKTDLKGHITYANRAFIEISGFTEQELIGQPHNIVRHPDMPAAAFEDMWRTLHAGHPWRGIVKNRSKDGGFYWVEAYATPLKENGVIVGFMSVRTTPTAQQKAEAEQLYAAIREQRASFPTTRLKQGWGLNRVLVLGLMPPLVALVIQLVVPDGLLRQVLNLGSILWIAIAAFLLHRSITVPLASTKASLDRLTEANFSHPFQKSGCAELQLMQESLETMRINLRAVISDVVAGAGTVSDAAVSAHSQSEALQKRGELALEGVSRIASALEQLAVSSSEIASSTDTGAAHANHANELAENGENNMKKTEDAAQTASREFHSTRESITVLTQCVADIGSITSLIRDLADQTNLLALNAAIEAARAGEQGRGFAVVADEVRKLAERTTGNTQEIEQSIGVLTRQTGHVTSNIESALKQVIEIEQAIQAVSASLAEIRGANQGVASASSSVNDMLRQQSASAAEVAQNMELMNAMTEQNSQSIATVNQVANGLRTTANDLKLLVKRFEAHL